MRGNVNLLKETIEVLKNAGKSPADVQWVGVTAKQWKKRPAVVGSWDQFAALADFSYNAGYGGNEVEGDLVIVGDNWWLERGEYDGSEWWGFKTLPLKTENAEPLTQNDLLERI